MAAITGRVIGVDRQPAVGAYVYAIRAEASGSAQTDAAGAFEIRDLAPGAYWVAATAADRAFCKIENVHPGDELVLALKPPSTLTVIVEGRANLACHSSYEDMRADAVDHEHTFTNVQCDLVTCHAFGTHGHARGVVEMTAAPARRQLRLEPYAILTWIVVDAKSSSRSPESTRAPQESHRPMREDASSSCARSPTTIGA